MLTHKAKKAEIAEWKKTFESYKGLLQPNRKSGGEIARYLCERYPVRPIFEEKALDVVRENVAENEHFRKKLSEGALPHPVTFFVERSATGGRLYEDKEEIFKDVEEIFVGIDLETGYFCVEGSGELYDELIAFRGLDDRDLENFYLVAEYVAAAQKFGVSLPSVKE